MPLLRLLLRLLFHPATNPAAYNLHRAPAMFLLLPLCRFLFNAHMLPLPQTCYLPPLRPCHLLLLLL